jgi:hypothetical protein
MKAYILRVKPTNTILGVYKILSRAIRERANIIEGERILKNYNNAREKNERFSDVIETRIGIYAIEEFWLQ